MRNIIICAAFNNWELTRMTYESVLARSEQDFKLILINNGSTDETQKWMDTLNGPDHAWVLPGELPCRDAKVTLVTSPVNGGCGIGRNIGMRMALAAMDSGVWEKADYITLIDNDIVTTQGWDTEILNFMDRHPEIGISGPMTNFAGTPQLLDKERYRKIDHPVPETLPEIEPFAQWFREAHRGKWTYVPGDLIVIGFVMVLRRQCLEQAGLFDERYKLYGYEDTDKCRQVRQMGWKIAYFGGCYVHHWGSKSVGQLGEAFGVTYNENKKAFEEKWGRPA